MKQIIDFYTRLAANNNKPWFDEHKDEYLAVKAKIEALAMDFAGLIGAFDHRVHDLQPKDITYRIYRDIRFSPDKTPYKDWCGIYVCPNGKKSGMAGYYIHIQPADNTFFLCGGLYNPTKEVQKSIRDEIMLEPDKFKAAVDVCGTDFKLSWNNALKKMPKGYDESDKCSEYYRLKSYEIYKPLTKADLLKKDFLKYAAAELSKVYQYNELLNVCYDFVN